MSDKPLAELIKKAEWALTHGFTFYQKWTCRACLERCVSDEPDVVHTSMIHSDCPVQPNYETDITKRGGGLLLTKALKATTVNNNVYN